MNSYDSILQMCYYRYIEEFNNCSHPFLLNGFDEPYDKVTFELTYFKDEDLMYEILSYDEYQMYLQAKEEYEF